MDYLLLSYLLYQHGIVPPHIVAGDQPQPAGDRLAAAPGGAFFLRRSIRGNALYAAVFSEYVAQLVGEGFSIEYFIEGGRSRTGRLLPPKGGMLAMTVRAFLRAPRRPVVFQPVYIGYEKLIEGKQLPRRADRPAEEEGIDLGAAARRRRGPADATTARSTVNFGEPIRLDERAGRARAGLAASAVDEDEKPGWLGDAVDELAQQHPGQHQPRRRRQPDQPAGAGAAVHAQARDGRSRPARAAGAVARSCCAALPYSDRVTVTPHDAGGDRRLRRGDRRADARRASARRRAQRGRRDRGAAELLPQQRAAPVHRRGVDRAVLPEQPADVARRRAAPGPHHLSVHRRRSCSCRGARTSSPSASTRPSTCSSPRACCSRSATTTAASSPAARARPTRCSACARSRTCAAAGVRALLHRDHHAGEERPAARSAPANWKRCATWPRSACRCCTRRRRRSSSTSRCSAASSRSCAT